LEEIAVQGKSFIHPFLIHRTQLNILIQE